MEILLSIAIGIGLSAACGFRIFVPPLVMSLAAHAGYLHISPDFQWMGTNSALEAFAVATFVEMFAYYIPWVDNLLDTVSTPTAFAVGTYITAALFPDTDPLLKWAVAAMAGGGSAGIIQALTAMVRLSSTALTVGMGNPIVATIEAGSAIILSLLAIGVPVLAFGLVAGCLILIFRKGYLTKLVKKLLPQARETTAPNID